MITFAKKIDVPAQVPEKLEENRFERIRKDAADAHKKADAKRSRDKPPV